MKPRIGITMGDPAGIGPEVLLKVMVKNLLPKSADYLIFGDRNYLSLLATYYKLKVNFDKYIFSPCLKIENKKLIFGVVNKTFGEVSGDYISQAIQFASEKKVDAIVTLPINKQSFSLSKWGKNFIGHTEMLASLTKTSRYALMLMNHHFRAIHVTQHIPLKDVPRIISTKKIFDIILLANEALRKLSINKPKIAVCGLNPHAGDNGLLGKEDLRIILPAVRISKKKGIAVFGPMPSDALWIGVFKKVYDVGIAMYHDQGQIPVKLVGAFGNSNHYSGVNVTLGLPIIRTSVAHGTAYDIAGKNMASTVSFVDAINAALSLVNKKFKF